MSQKPDQWKFEDEIDSQMAIDINRDRNMMDYVLYNQNGIAFVTLAGIMKVANNEGFTTEVCNVTRTQASVEAIVKVTAPAIDESKTRSAWSGREEYLKDSNGRPDKYAVVKAINIAIKNACKTLLYGHPDIELMLTEFVRDNVFVPPPTPQAKPATPKQSQPAKQQQPATAKQQQPQPATWQDKARNLWAAAKAEFEKMNVHDEDIVEVFRMWSFYFNVCAPEDVPLEKWELIHNFLKEEGYGIIGKFYREPPDNFREVLEQHGYKPAKPEENGNETPNTEAKPEQPKSDESLNKF